MRIGDWAVVTMMGGILTYDLVTPPGETVSEAVDRYLERRPILTTIFIGITAGHLLNRIPVYLDLYALFFAGVGRFVRRSIHNAQPS
jgi:hypothetical protein